MINITSLADGWWVIAPAGPIDGQLLAQFEQSLLEELAAGHAHLVLDMSQVTGVAHQGFRVLVSLWKRARDAKGNLILSNPQPRVRETLNLIGFDLVFTIVDQPADVLNGKR
jgi:anti-sigma B factor antagonist